MANQADEIATAQSVEGMEQSISPITREQGGSVQVAALSWINMQDLNIAAASDSEHEENENDSEDELAD